MGSPVKVWKTAALVAGFALVFAGAAALMPTLAAQGTRAPLTELRSALLSGSSLGVTIRDLSEAGHQP